jgi:hypothetical protein
MTRPLYPRGRNPRYTFNRRLRGPQGLSEWHGEVKILDTTGTRAPKSLYRLRYLGSVKHNKVFNFTLHCTTEKFFIGLLHSKNNNTLLRLLCLGKLGVQQLDKEVFRILCNTKISQEHIAGFYPEPDKSVAHSQVPFLWDIFYVVLPSTRKPPEHLYRSGYMQLA